MNVDQLCAALDSLDIPITSVDPQGKILFVNAVAARNLSGTRDSLVGKSLFGFFPEHAAATRERIRQTFNTRSTQQFEAVVSLPSGEPKFFVSSYHPTFGSDGDVVAIQIVAIDLTEIRGSQAAGDRLASPWRVTTDDLSMTAERLAAVLRSIPMNVAVHDPDMTIRYMNWAPAGIDLANVIGTSPLGWLTAEGQEAMKDAFARVLGGHEAVEYQATGRTGREWLSRLVPLMHEGGVKQLLSCSIDITEQRRLESQLRRRQKLESLGTMAGGIAHDFNNLLTAIAGNLGLARAQLAEGKDPEPSLANIDSAFRRAAELCKQMLAYAGQDLPQRELADLNEVVKEMGSLARAAVSSKIDMRYELAESAPAISCNEGQVGQVVLNLIANAGDAIGDGYGAITIETDAAVLEEDAASGFPEPPAAGRYCRLRVSDTGAGIAATDLPLIFDPFYSTKSSGRGMGLSVALGILSSHGAAIVVESTPGEGSTMAVYFPAHEGPTPVEEGRQPFEPTPHTEATVLVVDDDAAVRHVASAVLASAGYRVIEAADGDEALMAIAAERGIDAVLLDLTMPNRDGFSTLAELRKTHLALPVLLSSGKLITVPEDLGNDRYLRILQKPYAPGDLIAAIGGMVHSRQ